MHSETNKKQLFLAVADTLSKAAAVELTNERGYEILGESGYIHDVINEMSEKNFNSILCSEKLLDGSAKQLCGLVNERVGYDHHIYVLSRSNSKVLNLKNLGRSLKASSEYGIQYAIEKTLALVQIPATLKGYTLLKDALIITTAAPQTLADITNSVYLQLAKAHNISKDSVEFNMRTAKDRSWHGCSLVTLYKIFGVSCQNGDKAPSLSEYLSALTTYIIKNL